MIEKDQLLAELGSSYTNKVVERFHRFAFISPKVLDQLAKDALSEHWGKDHYALTKYLAVNVPEH